MCQFLPEMVYVELKTGKTSKIWSCYYWEFFLTVYPIKLWPCVSVVLPNTFPELQRFTV